MGRRENPVNRTVPARAALADFLRARRDQAGLTYQQMASQGGSVSAATFERATSGALVPSWETVEALILATVSDRDFHLSLVLGDGHRLWIKARRATRAPYYVREAPDPRLLATPADFLRALRRQHVWAGSPSAGEMERASGPGHLPATTARRIIAGDVLPVDPQQAVAFLKACFVAEAADLEQWLAAAVRVLGDVPSRARSLDQWVRARAQMARQIQSEKAAATTVRLVRSIDEQAA
ncbi:helix-turn-helix domain-containing protein [Streptomyces sp. NPDC055109]